MTTVAYVIAGLVAALHLYFLVLEMFLWTAPAGRKAFGLTPEFAEETKTLGANQGLYNGFLVAGLVFGMIRTDVPTIAFFLSCVMVAGVYGAATVSRKILFVQAVPAALGLLALWVASA